MSKKVLIGYSTWSGTTHEVADAISQELQKAGFQTQVCNLKKFTLEEEYDAYLLGTSIHASRPGGPFLKFLKDNYTELNKKPSAFFVVCANLYQDTPENRKETMEWMDEALKDIPEISVLDTGLFGGAVLTSGEDYEKLNFAVKLVIKSTKKSVDEKLSGNDFRDWEKIRAWANEIAKKIK
jgi:menaquinone-dependent protoporphyrinogen oxidase